MQLDLLGLACPMPIIKFKKFLAEQQCDLLEIELHIDDRGGLKDIPAFCQHKGLGCELQQTEPVIIFKIQGQLKSQ